MSMRSRFRSLACGLGAGVAVAAMAMGASPASAETFKIGIVTFLSGQAAEAFGVPAANGAKTMIAGLNAGKLPAPYDTKGFGGMEIQPIIIDEAGGATKQVQELRNLIQREQVDAVVGYISSGDCLAVGPVAEELKALLILFDCGTPRIFEDNQFEYVFRTAAHATMDNVGLVRYMKDHDVKVGTYSAINQDYAWGHDSRNDFVAAMGQLYPEAKFEADLLPKFGAGQYGTEISALLRQGSDLVYSSNWGGDLQALVLQAGPRGLFKRSQVVFSAADHVLPALGDKMPDGTIIGARGAYGLMSEETPLNTWFQTTYTAEHGVYPVQAPYRVSQALLGLKTAIEKAMSENGGKKPTTDEIRAALKGSTWNSPGGQITMANGNGHQAIQDIAFGRTRYDADKKMVVIEDIGRYPAKCVNPPADMKANDWIKAGFPGAACN
ncbi:ABC transporter substrate-binding protein [Tistrella bauzanensis]|uniref:ABC transporter substrate-binding protein n=1 Tax=Tistrella bauzanensis TaxID=657419 RepID=A0ABQ1IRI6_9PROT|nr:ABC transporter substrate-binding protein [Tistrella bauzanensis]GGB47304.1 ABC transporter substrate-binding protein [Tistrella bauzanensis]